MTRIKVGITIDAPPERVWAAIAHIDTHTRWMAEAQAIRALGDRDTGVGAEFECQTRVGPLRTRDVLVVTEWEPPRVMGVTHRGAVTGTGRFVLAPRRGGRTRFSWDERLSFPWWMGGAVGGLAGRRLLRRVWTENLHHLKRIVEQQPEPPAGVGGSPE
jgi:uncharacterized protein YndB with AHSA1/START domain